LQELEGIVPLPTALVLLSWKRGTRVALNDGVGIIVPFVCAMWRCSKDERSAFLRRLPLTPQLLVSGYAVSHTLNSLRHAAHDPDGACAARESLAASEARPGFA
jgi:hypothetical protein